MIVQRRVREHFEAIQYDGTNAVEIGRFANLIYSSLDASGALRAVDADGDHQLLEPGDWLVGGTGWFVVDNEYFVRTYEPVEDQ